MDNDIYLDMDMDMDTGIAKPDTAKPVIHTNTISVTQWDIVNGCPAHNNSCPIAMAMRRQGYIDVNVSDESIIACNSTLTEYYKMPLPDAVKEFIKAFDIGEKSEPFVFEFTSVRINV